MVILLDYPFAFGLPATVPGKLSVCWDLRLPIALAIALPIVLPIELAMEFPVDFAYCIWMPCGSLLDVFFMSCCYLLETFWHLLDVCGEPF